MCAGQAAAAPGTDKDFWNRALKTPLSDDPKPVSGGKGAYPELYRGEDRTTTAHAAYVSASCACPTLICNGSVTQQYCFRPRQRSCLAGPCVPSVVRPQS